MSFLRDRLAADVLAVPRGVAGVDILAVDFGNQNVSDGVKNAFGRGFEQVGDAEKKPVVAEANRIVDAGKREEVDMNFRHRSPRTQLAVGSVKDFDWGAIHVVRLAEARS